MQLFHLPPPPSPLKWCVWEEGRSSGLRNTHTHTTPPAMIWVSLNSLSGGRNGMARFPRDRDIHPPHLHSLAMSPTNLSPHNVTIIIATNSPSYLSDFHFSSSWVTSTSHDTSWQQQPVLVYHNSNLLPHPQTITATTPAHSPPTSYPVDFMIIATSPAHLFKYYGWYNSSTNKL